MEKQPRKRIPKKPETDKSVVHKEVDTDRIKLGIQHFSTEEERKSWKQPAGFLEDIDKTIAGTGRIKMEVKKVKGLENINELQPEGSYQWAKNQMLVNSELLRRKQWPVHDFVFRRQMTVKKISAATGFYEPLTQVFLQAIGVDKLQISGHYNRFTNGFLRVGYIFTNEDKTMKDWEIYKKPLENSEK